MSIGYEAKVFFKVDKNKQNNVFKTLIRSLAVKYYKRRKK